MRNDHAMPVDSELGFQLKNAISAVQQSEGKSVRMCTQNIDRSVGYWDVTCLAVISWRHA